MKTTILSLALAAVATLAPHAAHAQSPTQGLSPSEAVILAGPCATCHGSEGEGAKPVPALNDKPVEALLILLMSHRDGTTPSTVMGRHAKAYSDAQLKLLADHYGTD